MLEISNLVIVIMVQVLLDTKKIIVLYLYAQWILIVCYVIQFMILVSSKVIDSVLPIVWSILL